MKIQSRSPVALRAELVFDPVGLVVAMFQHQPATFAQAGVGTCNNPLQVIHAIRSGGQGAAGLKADVPLLEMFILLLDIGRVAENKIKGFAWQRVTPASPDKADIFNAEPAGVAGCTNKGLCRHVGRNNPAAWPLGRNCECDCTAARAKVGNMQAAIGWNFLECQCDQCFGFRARYQGVLADGKR
jgi:hypothetical protein